MNGFRNVIVLDNNSDAEYLLDYFKSDRFSEIALLRDLKANLGPRKALALAQQSLGPNAPFIFTDPDLLLPDQPHSEMISYMFRLGEKYDCLKVGLALDISHPVRFREELRLGSLSVLDWEKRFWKRQVEPDVYRAPIDTTFFVHVPASNGIKPLYSYGQKQARIPALRLAGAGFLAQHRPWYAEDKIPTSERDHYLASATHVASWARSSEGEGTQNK